MLPNSAYAFMDMYENPMVEMTPEQRELENIQEFFFEKPIQTREVLVNTKIHDRDIKELRGTPLFKQLRIKATNHFKIKAHEEMLREKKLEAEAQAKMMQEVENEEEKTLEELQEENLQNFFDVAKRDQKDSEDKKSRFNIFKRNKKTDLTEDKDSEESAETSEEEVTAEPSDETVTIHSGVKQTEAQKDAILDCEVVNYLDESGEIEALGRPTLSFPTQGVSITADRLTYNSITNVLKAYDNVEVVRDGNVMNGDYLQVNMNEENALMTNLKFDQLNMTIYAENVNALDDMVILENGKIASEKSHVLRFQTQFSRARLDRMVIPDAARSHLDDMVGHTKVKVVAKNIKINAKDEHDVITIKDGKLQFGDTKIFNIRNFTVHTNKNHKYIETNIPEFGSRSRVGMFAGPGFAFDTPFASTVKVIPLVNYKDGFGFGGALRYTSATNRTDMMYGSAKDIFVLRGKQFLDDRLKLQYGVNSYMNDWWMGQRMAKYLAELIYMDGTRIPDFMGENRPLTFKHRASFGYMHDSDVNRFDEKIKSSMIGTTRFKYMAQISQSLYSYHNKEKRLHLDAGLGLQGSAAVYGTGDTQFVGRIGPYVHTQYKYWMQDIGYFQSAYDDKTPLPRFDAFRYGKSNVYLREAIRVNKYLTVAYATSINLSDDAPNNKQFQENAFIVAVGPDDFKVSLGYDFMREQTFFTLNVALETKGSSVEFDRMEITNPDKLGKTKKYVKPVVFPEEIVAKKPTKRTYAQVIDIEDPDKEKI